MKTGHRIFFSIFYLLAIGVHIYFLGVETDKKWLWHGAYLLTYGLSWWTYFTRLPQRAIIFVAASLFPFFSHVVIGYQHIPALDFMFWVCLLVCIIIPYGYYIHRQYPATGR
ncbi:MAG TPA: hypothetical protein PLW43_12285 [Chitinophagales bacterium]|nr:hypothetical protein [Chitinophagales bacterium]